MVYIIPGVKLTFGNFVERIFSGGDRLTEVESKLLVQLVTALPLALRSVVEAQFEVYNLMQREVDGRALNFYRRKNGQGNNMDGLPLLVMDAEEAPLVRLTAMVSDDEEPLHATLTAVKGRVFCVALSRPVRAKGTVTVQKIKQAWLSNFPSESS